MCVCVCVCVCELRWHGRRKLGTSRDFGLSATTGWLSSHMCGSLFLYETKQMFLSDALAAVPYGA